jgi:hypothetical protein
MRKPHLLLALAVALSVPSGMYAQMAPAAPARPAGSPMAGKMHEDPAIRGAIKHLEEAQTALKSGKHDFDGHRSNAIKAVDEALRECHEALKSAHNEAP